jgi:hypothetical protein
MERKEIARLVSPMKQLKIKKEAEEVFSPLQCESLPNEVILHVFSYLKILDLLNCGQVSKRFRAISNDEHIWPKKFNLFCKKVPVGFLKKILDHGCKYLSLSEATLEGTLNLQKASRLKYLDLSGFEPKSNRENSEKMLEASYFLEKLSLSQFHLSSKLISIISLQNGKTLKVLDLSQSTFCRNENNCTCTVALYVTGFRCLNDSSCISDVPIEQIVENCSALKELNLSSTQLCEKSVDFLVSNLTPKIEKLNLYDIFCVRDKHIQTLVTRCNKMTELNFGGLTSTTRNSLNFVIEHLQSTLVKINLQFGNFVLDSSDFFKLKSIEKLKLLCYYDDGVDIQMLKKMLPNLQIDFHTANLRIASPFWVMGSVMGEHHGFWEINAERAEELFSGYDSDFYEDNYDFYEEISD